jgi:hypothetical protein
LILKGHFENRKNLNKSTGAFSETADDYAFRKTTVGCVKRGKKIKREERGYAICLVMDILSTQIAALVGRFCERKPNLNVLVKYWS